MPILIFLIWIVYGYLKIFGLPEKEHKKYGDLKQNYGQMLYLLDSILITPCFGVLLKLFICGESSGVSGAPECLSSIHIIFSVLAGTLLFALFTSVVLVGMFFFNYYFKDRDSLSRSSNIMHLGFRLYQIIAIAVDLFIFDQDQSFTVNLFLHSISATIFCLDYNKRIPYYNPKVSEAYCFCVYSYFWVNLVLLITHLANIEIINSNVIFVIFIGLMFFLYIVKTFREYFYRSLIIKEIWEIDNEIYLDVRFRYLMAISKNAKKDKKDELLLTSIIKVHTEKCVNCSCICKRREVLYDPKNKKYSNPNVPIFKDGVFIKNYLLMLAQQSCKKMPRSSLLNINYFLFLFEELNNLPSVNHQISLFEKQFHNSLFITVQYAIFRVRISIHYVLKKWNKSEYLSRNLYENIRVYDEGMAQFREMSLEIVESYARMWDILNDPAPDFTVLEQVCTKITDNKKKAYRKYKEILHVTNTSMNLLAIMKVYSKFIIFDDLLLMEVEETIKASREPLMKDSLMMKKEDFKKSFHDIETNWCSISVSLNLENLGQIVWSSQSCEAMFGYESNYFRTFNIAHILPQNIAIKHHSLLMNYFKTGRQTMLHNMVHGWALNKENFIMSILITMKIFINQEGLSALSLISPQNKDDYVVLNERGEVQGVGVEAFKVLKMPPDLRKKDIIISLIATCPALIPLILDEFYGIKDFRFNGKTHNEVINNLDNFYIFFTHNYKEETQELTQKLQAIMSIYRPENHAKTMAKYCNILYNYLSNIKIGDIAEAYKLGVTLNKLTFSLNIRIIEIRISLVQKVDLNFFKNKIFRREFAFVEKLDMNHVRINSIENYNLEKKRKLREKNGLNAGMTIKTEPKKMNMNLYGRSANRRDSKMYVSTNPDMKSKKPALGPDGLPPVITKSPKNVRRRRNRRTTFLKNQNEVPSKAEISINGPSEKTPLMLNRLKKKTLDNIEEKIETIESGKIHTQNSTEPVKQAVKKPKFKLGGIGGKGGFKNSIKGKFKGLKGKVKEKMNEGRLKQKENLEEKLNLALDKVHPDYYLSNYNEEPDERFLIEINDYDSEGSKIKSEKSSELSEIKKKNMLLVQLNKVKNGGVPTHFDVGNSVGSGASRISHRDSMKRIRNAINAQRAPRDLVASRYFLLMSVLSCAIINIGSYLAITHLFGEDKKLVQQAQDLANLSIRLNKLNTFLTMKQLVKPPYNIDFETSYGEQTMQYIYKESDKILESTTFFMNREIGRFTKGTGYMPALKAYFDNFQTFYIQGSVFKFSMMEYIVYYMTEASHLMRSDSNIGDSFVLSINNMNSFAQLQIKAYHDITEKSVSIEFYILLVYYLDLIVRALLIIAGILVAFPLIFSASKKSREILLQLSKISQINVAFYIQHYNKLGIYLKSNSGPKEIFSRVLNFYEAEFILKRQREMRSGNIRIARFIKKDQGGKLIWTLAGMISVVCLLGIQIFRKVLFQVDTISFKKQVPKILLVQSIGNSYSLLNQISFNQLVYQFNGNITDPSYMASQGMQKYVEIFMNQSTIAFTLSRADIYSEKFRVELGNLFDTNLCETVYLDSNETQKCEGEATDFGRHGLKALIAMYNLNIWSRIRFLERQHSPEVLKKYIESSEIREPIYILHWMLLAYEYWENGLIYQFNAFIDQTSTIALGLTIFETLILLTFVMFLTFYIYPIIRKKLAYSLGFLLLIPFHIYKENEGFSTYIKNKINYKGYI